mmetsp:Transcript_24444/g.61446  ORF Transcript_24444/g.61446 Transcript_24444/m.61446 type:complete len:226 (-) Transcript_24444:410-1087(-)
MPCRSGRGGSQVPSERCDRVLNWNREPKFSTRSRDVKTWSPTLGDITRTKCFATHVFEGALLFFEAWPRDFDVAEPRQLGVDPKCFPQSSQKYCGWLSCEHVELVSEWISPAAGGLSVGTTGALRAPASARARSCHLCFRFLPGERELTGMTDARIFTGENGSASCFTPANCPTSTLLDGSNPSCLSFCLLPLPLPLEVDDSVAAEVPPPAFAICIPPPLALAAK